LFPIIDVPSWQVFTMKIVSVLAVTQLIGLGIYNLGRRRAAERTPEVVHA
jgi:hypothetical protein